MIKYLSTLLIPTLAQLVFCQESGEALRPFSATILSTFLEGDRSFELHGRYAQSSDGSNIYVSENDPPANEAGLRGEFSYVLNMKKRVYIGTHSLIKSAIVRPVADAADMSNIQPRHSCKWLTDGTWTRVGESTMRGFRVVEVIDEEETSPGRTFQIKLWVAPDLNCFKMKRTHTKNGILVNKDIVQTLELKEPDPSVFDVPLGYATVTPSEFEMRYRTKFPGKQLRSDDLVIRQQQQYQRAVDKAASKVH